jgi:hypothetical protein
LIYIIKHLGNKEGIACRRGGRKPRAKEKKNPQGISHYGILDPRGERINRTNVFLTPPSYKKPPHACKGL